METTFHLAVKVKDLESTIKFYHHILGCTLGRKTASWVDFNFFGHQLSAHVSEEISKPDYCGKVEDLQVPIPHFGCILGKNTFNNIKERLESHHINFLIKPQKRYENEKGAQQTMFILDFSNNPIEFKSFDCNEHVFQSR